MSVLKEKRTQSAAEYVNVANQIYVETVSFLTRLSARYSRLVAEPVAKLAGEVIDNAEKANKIFPSDQQRKDLRKAHLLEALASLSALDVRLAHCYEVMYQNPQGCFRDSEDCKNMDDPEGDGTGAEGQKRKGRKKTITPQQAMDRLDNMELLTKSLVRGARRENRKKKDAYRRHPIHLIILFKFKAVAERRQWSSAASNPRRKTRVKLCPHF